MVNGSCGIKEFGILPHFFHIQIKFRWKFQPFPSFHSHSNIPDIFVGGKMTIFRLSFSISLQIKRTKVRAGLHKLWYPGIRDTSTWSKLGAHGEQRDVFLFSNLGVL